MSHPAPDLVDIGANLTHDSFDPDRAAVLERAADAGVRRVLIHSRSEQSALDLAEHARSLGMDAEAVTDADQAAADPVRRMDSLMEPRKSPERENSSRKRNMKWMPKSMPRPARMPAMMGTAGTTQVAVTFPDTVLERKITVRFNADVSRNMPWKFEPGQRQTSGAPD